MYSIDKKLDINKYKCLIGVPYGYGHLIGQEVYFIESATKIYGPFLIVDVEATYHQGLMDTNNILADTNCKEMVHKKGVLLGIKKT